MISRLRALTLFLWLWPVAPAQQTPRTASQQPPPNSGIRTVSPQRPPENIIEAVGFQGSRRVPQDTLLAIISTKPGNVCDEDALHRDFMALWNTGRFDDIRVEREAGQKGWIVRYVLMERRSVRAVPDDGIDSIPQAKVLDRFKAR
jgi:outer membrane protein insertion porin family